MQRKTDEQMDLNERLKVARAITRLKHSLQADRELNDLLPSIVLDHTAAIQRGEAKRLNPGWADDLLHED